MLIVGITDPEGRTTYFAARLPQRLRQDQPRHARSRACPATRSRRSATTSAGCTSGSDGRLWAINPEAGMFGVAAGHQHEDQPQRHARRRPRRHLHERRAHAPTARRGGKGWTTTARRGAVDWQGRRGTPDRARAGRASRTPASRSRAAQCPSVGAGHRRTRGRADLRHHLRRPARQAALRSSSKRRASRTASTSARRWSPRRRRPPPAQLGVAAPRPDGDASVLWLQHGRLLPHWLDVGKRSRARRASST